MKYGFGIDLGGTTVKLAFFDETGAMLAKWEIPTVTANNGEQILPDIATSVRKYLTENSIDPGNILGIGLGVPGAVRPDGTVNRCVNLGWGVFNVQTELEKLTGFPVKAGNDATIAALGECWKGGGAGYHTLVLATLGTGVGGGIILDSKPLYGANGAGGEIGHMVLNRNEAEKCGCGKQGCVEQYCSATGIVRVAKKMLSASDAACGLRNIDNFTCKDVFALSSGGDAFAQEILEQIYAYMGEFLANACCVIDPEIIVLGGGVSRAGQPLLDGVEKYFKKYAFHAQVNTKFALATLGNDAGVYGAFKLALDEQEGKLC